MLLENIHFRLSWHSARLLGRKSLAVSISDIAAMGAIPRWALLSIALPAELPVDFIDEFSSGFLDMAKEHGVSLVGGDTCASRNGFIISVTIMGEQFPDRIMRRSGAKAGDEIWVTGTLGDAAMGLKILESDSDPAQPPSLLQLPDNLLSRIPGKKHLISRLLDPAPRVAAGLSLAESGLATSMIDISDGILGDFGHIAELSKVGGIIYLEALPLSAELRSFPDHFLDMTSSLSLTGGEDYEICFTAPPSHREKIYSCMKNCGITASPVGIVTSFQGISVIKGDGSEFNPQSTSFNHFT
jgi:thiamine-monophosphate kinase